MNAPHAPVLLAEVVAALAPRDGAVFVDGTFGAGGYTRELLRAAACRVYAIDRDPAAIEAARRLAADHGDRLVAIQGCFGDMDRLLADRGVDGADGVALDVGVSSMQLDQPERGFSFRADGPLDMRMGSDGPTAADVVNEMPEEELADILFRLGEERRARQVARAIVEARRNAPITRTLQLAEIVAPVAHRTPGIHPATRTFQALRIHVNDELGELARGLAAAERVLRPAGRLAVVSFHSLEDRIVKRFLDERAGRTARPSRHAPALPAAERRPSFVLPKRGVVTPGAEEIARNPRARSAKLRIAERTDAPAMEAAA